MASKCVRYLTASVLAFAVLAWAAGSAGQTTERTRTFKIGKGGTLIVQIEGVGADILVSTWEKNEIELRIDGLSDQDLKDLETREEGNVVHVELYLDRGWGKSGSARFSFTVPIEINLDLGTSGGDVTVANLIKGAVTAGTSGGDIEIGEVAGNVNAATSGGDVEIGKVTGKVELKTAGGDVKAIEVIGDAELETSGGDIEVGDIKGACTASTSGGDIKVGKVDKTLVASTAGGDITIDDVGGDARASTAGGDVIVGMVSGSATLKTAGGDIELHGATGTVEAKTAGGDIECANVTGSITAGTAGGDVYAELNPTGTGLNSLETAGGDVQIVLPADAKATIDAKIKIRRGWGGDDEDYDILSDFPAETHEKDKKLVRGHYVIGGGGATIRLETVNGNIEIRKGTRPK
ncbi:MAG: hypothetical protein H6Q78_1271 [Candidatus Krumholzibacteriota bacterium]|nr:hypothetical protein [Candidatus Krumholzibacteriota bacterium]